VLWNARDENDDELRFSVYFRGENETDWKLLRKNSNRSFIPGQHRDARRRLYLKIVATEPHPDSPAAGTDYRAAKASASWWTTPPVVDELKAEIAGAQKTRRFHFVARDATSSIDRAQYSCHGGDGSS